MSCYYLEFLKVIIILLVIPVASTGGIAALSILNQFIKQPLDMLTMLGFVILVGIVVNNAIVMLDFVKQLRRQGFEAREAMVTAAAVRFRPVLLTAVTTILGLAPLAIGMDVDFTRDNPVVLGAEGGSFWKSMALAIMYG